MFNVFTHRGSSACRKYSLLMVATFSSLLPNIPVITPRRGCYFSALSCPPVCLRDNRKSFKLLTNFDIIFGGWNVRVISNSYLDFGSDLHHDVDTGIFEWNFYRCRRGNYTACWLTCIGWTYQSGFCISYLWLLTDAFSIRCHSTCWTIAYLSLWGCQSTALWSASRHQLLLVPWCRRSTFGSRAFLVAGPTFWNSLPDKLRTYSSDRFKTVLKIFLFARY